MSVHFTDHIVIFQKWRHTRARIGNGKSGIDGIAEVAAVAGVMTGREGGCIGCRKGRKDRMAVDEIDAFPPKGGKCGRRFVVHNGGAQAVRDEQYDIMWRVHRCRARKRDDGERRPEQANRECDR